MTRFFITFFAPTLTILLIWASVFMAQQRRTQREEQLKRKYTKLYGGYMRDINGNVVPNYLKERENDNK